MADINTVNLLNQIRSMTEEASGSKIAASTQNHDSFNNVLMKALNQVNDFTKTSDGLKTRFELGDSTVSVGEVKIAEQKANLGFEAALRVRNKVVQAYQEIMNMPV